MVFGVDCMGVGVGDGLGRVSLGCLLVDEEVEEEVEEEEGMDLL